jgi:pentatricopeptide repeat protein
MKLGFEFNCFISTLVDLYGKYRPINEVRHIFDEILCEDLVQ